MLTDIQLLAEVLEKVVKVSYLLVNDWAVNRLNAITTCPQIWRLSQADPSCSRVNVKSSGASKVSITC